MTNEAQEKTRSRRSKVGTVVSKSGSKTVSVQIDNLVKHAMYGKYLRKRTKLAVHDEHEQAKVGDMVEIVSVRPLSKNKAHRLVRVVRPAVG
jgi:small subunit ribosomal protein S17